MHVGEKPYVVAPAGPVELSSRPLTLDAVAGMLGQLLPVEGRAALDELGAIEHDLPKGISGTTDRFSVVAARGGDDIWIEVRRHRKALAVVGPVAVPPPVSELIVPAAPLALVEAAEPVVEWIPPSTILDSIPEPIPEPLREPVAEPVTEAIPEPVAEAVVAAPERVVAEPSSAVPSADLALHPRDWEDEVEQQVAPLIETIPAVVLPPSRGPVRVEPSRVPASPRLAGVDRLLRLAVARGAHTLYLVSQTRPTVRVDGDIAMLEGERPLTTQEVEALLLDLAPERSREAVQNGEGTEWMSEVPEVGRVRCQSFRDHRGPGGIFRIISARPTSADQLGLSHEIQALAAEPEGLILVTGPRASGKTTVVSAFVDLVNATRSDYVVTIESHVQVVHEGRGCLVSQREVRGDAGEVAAAARAALRENPDVLVIDDLRSPEMMGVAVDAVAGGHLVIAAMPARTSAAALARLIDQAPPERREQVRMTLAEGLRGVVAQVLLHKSGGGRLAAREFLLNTPAIANLIAEGRVDQLPLALESGRKHGMVPLNDALAAFVQSGIVDVREAYRKAHERQAFLAVLRREGVDLSLLERLA